LEFDEETAMTEITIAPDGRIYLFGASMPVLQMLDNMNLNDPALTNRVRALKEFEVADKSAATIQTSDCSGSSATEAKRGNEGVTES
jgi:hypothetical protein